MNQFEEQFTEDMTRDIKQGADLSAWKKNRKTAPLLTLISHLENMPKSVVPTADFDRIKTQMLKRISVSATENKVNWFRGWLPIMLRVGAGLASLLIVVSLGLGTAVAAIESLPGQTLYPLKKVLENVELGLAPTSQKTSLQIQFANNRVDEVQQLLDQQQAGQISQAQAQKAISETVQDLQVHTSAAVVAAASQPLVVNNLADISNKLQIASIQTEGDVKIELEKALAASQISQEQAIKNIENAGLKVDTQPIILSGSVTASGKLTEVSVTSVSVGDLKFLINTDTQYVNGAATDLKIGTLVDIQGQIKDDETYATQITIVTDPAVSGTTTTQTVTPVDGTNSSTDTKKDNPDIIIIPDTTNPPATPATP